MGKQEKIIFAKIIFDGILSLMLLLSLSTCCFVSCKDISSGNYDSSTRNKTNKVESIYNGVNIGDSKSDIMIWVENSNLKAIEHKSSMGDSLTIYEEIFGKSLHVYFDENAKVNYKSL